MPEQPIHSEATQGERVDSRKSLFASCLRLRYRAWSWLKGFHEKIPGWPKRHGLDSFLANRMIDSHFKWEKHRG